MYFPLEINPGQNLIGPHSLLSLLSRSLQAYTFTSPSTFNIPLYFLSSHSPKLHLSIHSIFRTNGPIPSTPLSFVPSLPPYPLLLSVLRQFTSPSFPPFPQQPVCPYPPIYPKFLIHLYFNPQPYFNPPTFLTLVIRRWPSNPYPVLHLLLSDSRSFPNAPATFLPKLHFLRPLLSPLFHLFLFLSLFHLRFLHFLHYLAYSMV